MPNRKKHHLVIGPDGPPCPRCKQPTEIRAHREVTDKMLRQAFYYRQWFYCTNPKCVVSLYMREEHKVMPDQPHNIPDLHGIEDVTATFKAMFPRQWTATATATEY